MSAPTNDADRVGRGLAPAVQAPLKRGLSAARLTGGFSGRGTRNPPSFASQMPPSLPPLAFGHLPLTGGVGPFQGRFGRGALWAPVLPLLSGEVAPPQAVTEGAPSVSPDGSTAPPVGEPERRAEVVAPYIKPENAPSCGTFPYIYWKFGETMPNLPRKDPGRRAGSIFRERTKSRFRPGLLLTVRPFHGMVKTKEAKRWYGWLFQQLLC